ncbi:zinc finger protein 622-like [Harmonia axyridis]|uniref:zinc finger protein 622-like n=1 Tax=Harmonia axyridis TaxID=115357 RepID=UPI001E2771CB|nr:zinc finger protein 622-like [Harmonia axyridis]
MDGNASQSPADNKVTGCGICRLPLKNSEQFRAHYKTEWHNYNLKRNIVGLPPLTPEEFILKFNNLEQKQLPSKKKVTNYRCYECNKKFSSNSTYDDHLQSKKHQKNIRNTKEDVQNNVPKEESDIEEDSDVEEVDSDEWDNDNDNPLDRNQCLFCSHLSDNFYKNLEHMTSFHSFFIPDVEYCIDITGLLRYLGEKVYKHYICLWCNEKGKTFYTSDAVKAHMVDMGHCMMIYEGVALTEYVDFYDYSSSYPDTQNGVNEDAEVPVNILEGSEFSLVLPSGITIGHRSMMRYYKQNASRTSAVVPSKNTKKLHKVLATYRALGWSQSDQEQAARKARDIHYLKRVQSKLYTKLGVKQNKFQKHFRQQVNF